MYLVYLSTPSIYVGFGKIYPTTNNPGKRQSSLVFRKLVGLHFFLVDHDFLVVMLHQPLLVVMLPQPLLVVMLPQPLVVLLVVLKAVVVLEVVVVL